jgi:membrane protein DedA with SNARE-associated domain
MPGQGAVFGRRAIVEDMAAGLDVDYVTLAVGSFASWVGVPGPGEPLLIAAGILAAEHKLDLGAALGVAFAAAVLGGIVGWVIGFKAGRPVLARPGPFHRARLRALARGEEVFTRWPAVAVLLTTSWIAGVLRVETSVYLIWNAVGAALWTVGIGLGAYFAGPPVVHIVDASGWLTVVGVTGLVAAATAIELARRRHRAG